MRREPLVFVPWWLSLVMLAGCLAGKEDPPTTVATTNTSEAGYSKKPVDPIAANGKIFEDWPKPEVAIVITGQQNGYIEPCGCAGLENQKGGLARRHTFLKQLEADGWPTVAVDIGGLIDRFGRQAEIKYQITAEGLQTMGYDAIAFGPKDLRLPTEGLLALVAGDASPFVAANASLFEYAQPLRVVEAGGKKIGITAVLGEEYQKEINNDQIRFTPPATAIAEALPKLKEAGCDFLILLAHASRDEAEALAKQFPDFDVVATGGAEVPPHEMRRIEGQKTLLVEVGAKGQYAVVLGLYQGDPPIRYQRVPLDARFADSPDMKQLMVAYQGQLKELGFAGLGLRPKIHPRATAAGDATGQFVGAAKCGECHKTAYGIWSKTPHAKATHTLATTNPPRLFDPECLSCHSTGWSPQEYVPYQSGFLSMEETPLLEGNGCENCHGPGGAHVAAEAGKDLVLRDQLRQAMRLTRATVEQNVCIKCHDHDNSPNFDDHFDAYWAKIEHKGKK
ncbi:MAG: hypothetical protein HYX69_22155 [Planctomycetia bacterium]|nr:hypothetical protein [Planctomycetia bacterium]